MKIIIIGASPLSLTLFRGKLIQNLVDLGHAVIAMSSDTDMDSRNEIEKLGCQLITYPIDRTGLNPLSDIKTFNFFLKTFKLNKPDIILAYTIKPVIWGGIAAKIYKNAEFFGMITGLGFTFQDDGLKRSLIKYVVKKLYKFSLENSAGVIFQNNDNRNTFVNEKLVKADKTHTVSGSGVDIQNYKESIFPDGNFVFLTIARLLGDKGLREYAKAALIVKNKYPKVTFQLVGPEDSSPDGIAITEIIDWQNKGLIEYLGSTKDVRPFIQNCHVFVLASYHEGMPRTVLESMSMGRPILTTNVAGCRETVEIGINGYLVPKANAVLLAEKMVWFIENEDQLDIMGKKSREIAVEKFDVNNVNENIIKILGCQNKKEK